MFSYDKLLRTNTQTCYDTCYVCYDEHMKAYYVMFAYLASFVSLEDDYSIVSILIAESCCLSITLHAKVLIVNPPKSSSTGTVSFILL